MARQFCIENVNQDEILDLIKSEAKRSLKKKPLTPEEKKNYCRCHTFWTTVFYLPDEKETKQSEYNTNPVSCAICGKSKIPVFVEEIWIKPNNAELS